jgi:hypothetical protein
VTTKRGVSKLRFGLLSLLYGLTPAGHAAGIPLMPLNLGSRMEAQIERVLILCGQHITTRPIPAAMLLKALPKACKIDSELCGQVQRFLDKFTHSYRLRGSSVEGAAARGMGERASWAASVQGYLLPAE